MSTKLNFRTRPVPDKFNPNARYSGQLEGVKTLGTDITIKEAIEKNFIANQKEDLVASTVIGVLKSMIAGVQSDGNARAIDGVISFTPYMTGGFAGKKSAFDPAKNSIIVRARLMKELKINNNLFSLTNATDGVVVKLANVCSATTDEGFVRIFEEIYLTGENLNDAEINFTYGDVSGRLTKKLNTSNTVVCQWPSEILEPIDGKEIIFTLTSRGGDDEGELQTVDRKAVVLASTGPKPLRITKVTSTATGNENEWKLFKDDTIIEGSGFDAATTATIRMVKVSDLTEVDLDERNTVTLLEDGSLKLHMEANTTPKPDGAWTQGYPTFVVVKRGDEEVTVPLIVVE